MCFCPGHANRDMHDDHILGVFSSNVLITLACIFKNASNENLKKVNFENSIEAELNDIRSTSNTLYGTRLVFCMDI